MTPTACALSFALFRKQAKGRRRGDNDGLVLGSLVAGGLSPRDVVFEQLFWAATHLILVGAVCPVIFVACSVRFSNTTETPTR